VYKKRKPNSATAKITPNMTKGLIEGENHIVRKNAIGIRGTVTAAPIILELVLTASLEAHTGQVISW
jgi:hypothetical protein